MENLQLEWMEAVITSTNKPKLNVSLTKADGTKMENVTIWPDFPGYADLKPGMNVFAKIVGKDYKGKTYYSLAVENAPTTPYKAKGNMTAVMEKKAEHIAHAQENKEFGIMTSSTIRMAVDIALAECQGLPFDVGVFKGRIREWRNFLIAEWDNVKTAPPFNS